MNNLTITPQLLAFIQGFEGCRLQAYQDSAGVWTIGYGSTRYANGQPVKKGDKLVNIECAVDLLEVTLKYYVTSANTLVKVPLNANEGIAVVDFMYNVGEGALAGSTLLKKLNAGDRAGAADEFLKWDKITDPKTGQKVVLNDLAVRRTKERALFLKPVTSIK